jgi:hypothetical protein
MPEMTIQLRRDPQTGKQNIIVKLRSEEDTLPYEHEQLHRALVDKLLEGGILKAGEEGNLLIEREEETAVPEWQRPAPGPQRLAQQQSGGPS